MIKYMKTTPVFISEWISTKELSGMITELTKFILKKIPAKIKDDQKTTMSNYMSLT